MIGSATRANNVTLIVVWARLKVLLSGHKFAYINTHLDHQSEPARINGGEAMIDMFDGGELDELPSIVTGDVNSVAHDLHHLGGRRADPRYLTRPVPTPRTTCR